MSRGRPKGYVVTHRLSAVMRAQNQPERTWRRCACGRAFYADSGPAAEALLNDHLDRMEKDGRPVLRER